MRRLISTWLLISAAYLPCEDARVAAQQPAKEYYLDFRNKRQPSADFGLHGPDPANEIKQENEGLRFTLRADRRGNWPAEIRPKFALVGDFEFTATYEMFAASEPDEGYGVGVNLTLGIREGGKMTTFAKISRVNRHKQGSIFLAEAWSPEPKSYRAKAKPSNAMSGQLRLTRVGPVLKFLFSDEPGKEFEEFWQLPNFGDVDLVHNGFSVSDSGKAGNSVDARLIDLRVRQGNIQLDKATDPAPLPAVAIAIPQAKETPVPTPQPPQPPQLDDSGPPMWLIIILAAGVGVLLLAVIVLGAVLMLRGKPAAPAPAASPPKKAGTPTPAHIVPCTSCGKKLKVKSQSAGKKLKCPQCGNAVAVPGNS
jgi:hypothetical protein